MESDPQSFEMKAPMLRPNPPQSDKSPSHDDIIFVQKPKQRIISRRGTRALFILLPTIIYVFLALLSWIITCIISHHPVDGKSYKYIYNSNAQPPSLYAESERWRRAVSVLGTVVNVATIPVISTVCASACIIYGQKRQIQERASGANLLTLADNGWANPIAYLQVLLESIHSSPKAFIWGISIFIYLVGSVTWPIESIFLSAKTVKTPTSTSSFGYIVDIPELVNKEAIESLASYQTNFATFALRGKLQSVNIKQIESTLWKRSPGFYKSTFEGLVNMNDPFYAQLPTSSNTGLIRQFSPRVNSTARYESINADQFPSQCESLPGAFYAEYNSSDSKYGFSLIACMPGNLSESPWKATRMRQDFSEELYLYANAPDDRYLGPISGYYKVTLNTTAGYFEVPNYMNDNSPGPLLAIDPLDACGSDCASQAEYATGSNKRRRIKDRRDNTSSLLEAGSFKSSANTQHKGPLFTIAVALFGPGSFLDTWQDTEADMDAAWIEGSVTADDGDICAGIAPMNLLLPIAEYSYYLGSPYAETKVSLLEACIEESGFPALAVLSSWVTNFARLDPNFLSNAFTYAAFLANQVFFDSTFQNWEISYDMGKDMEILVISLAGIIVVSVLMALYLAPLLVIAFYVAVVSHEAEEQAS